MGKTTRLFSVMTMLNKEKTVERTSVLKVSCGDVAYSRNMQPESLLL